MLGLADHGLLAERDTRASAGHRPGHDAGGRYRVRQKLRRTSTAELDVEAGLGGPPNYAADIAMLRPASIIRAAAVEFLAERKVAFAKFTAIYTYWLQQNHSSLVESDPSSCPRPRFGESGR